MKNARFFSFVLAVSALGSGLLGADELVSIDEIRRGEFVTIRGEVTRVPDYDEFILEDDTGRVEIDLGDRMRRPMVRRGDIVTVAGWVDDDSIRRPYEVYAVEIILEDGTVLEIDRREGD